MSEARSPTEMIGGMLAGWQPIRARSSARRAVALFTLVAMA